MQTGLILALVLGIATVVFLILKTKVQAFPALIVAAMVVGVVAGVPFDKLMQTIAGGFGSTLGSIGIVIGFGVMMGKVLEVTGAAKRMALTILKAFGLERADWVLAASGFLVSIPVFCDSGFVILSELSKEFSRVTKKSMVLLGCALGMGLYLTHHLVPPTPGPLAVAGTLKVDIGMMVLAGTAVGLVMLVVMVPVVRFIAARNPVVYPDGMPDNLKNQINLEAFDESKLPGTLISFAPIVVPVLLILMKTGSAALGIKSQIINLFCDPISALLVGLLLAVYGLMGKNPREDVVQVLEKSLSDAGLIILITGAGGALGAVLRESGVGAYVAQTIAKSGFPSILVPLVMASLLKLCQGSGTVAMITSANIMAPMLASLQLNPLIAALAICVGPMCASYFNDSYFWVVTRFSGMEVRTGLRAWTTTTALCGGLGAVIVIILSMFIKG